MSTEDIPYLGSLTRKAAHEAASSDARPQVVGRDVNGAAPLFDPGVVELNATMLLRFLQVRPIYGLFFFLCQSSPLLQGPFVMEFLQQ